MSTRKDWNFDFIVENITKEQAADLLDHILDMVVDMGAQMGGGFAEQPQTHEAIIADIVEDLKIALLVQAADEEE